MKILQILFMQVLFQIDFQNNPYSQIYVLRPSKKEDLNIEMKRIRGVGAEKNYRCPQFVSLYSDELTKNSKIWSSTSSSVNRYFYFSGKCWEHSKDNLETSLCSGRNLGSWWWNWTSMHLPFLWGQNA